MMQNKYQDWRDYQEKAAAFFKRKGCSAEVEAVVRGVRAEHKIDVLVSFLQHSIECKWIIECKLWNSHVPKEKVLALKAIVEDVGADRGIIITEKGYQSGAYDVARGSNITLVTSLEEFERTAETTTSHIKLVESAEESVYPFTLFKFPSGDNPHSLLNGEQKVFVGNWGSGNISVVDTSAKSITKIIGLDNYEVVSVVTNNKEIRQYPPGNMAIADGKLFVGQVFSDFILVIDIETQAIIKRIPVAGGGEGQLTSSADGKHIYFASNLVPQFLIIDSATYEIETISYPRNGRGSMSIYAHPNGELLYIGIQRGGTFKGKSHFGGNSFLAVYDIRHKRYISDIYLAEVVNNRSDDSTPSCITYDPVDNCLYVGMFQSRKGIYKIDTVTNQIIENMAFQPNEHNKHFTWVDPLAQVLHNDLLLSVNRNNYELAVINARTWKQVKTIYLGEAPNGPRDIIVTDKEAIISYPEKNGLMFIELSYLEGTT